MARFTNEWPHRKSAHLKKCILAEIESTFANIDLQSISFGVTAVASA